MKAKILNIATYIIMAMISFTLYSCEDEDIAQTLDGIWEGEVATEYFSYRWGTRTEYQAVDIEFYVDPYRYARGTGVEYDYDSRYYYTECGFYFEVYNGIIYLDYDDGSQVAIRNYRLTDNRFSGEFINYRTGEYLASFNFVKVNNWRHYRNSRAGEPSYKKVPSPILQHQQ